MWDVVKAILINGLVQRGHGLTARVGGAAEAQFVFTVQ